MNIVVGSAFRNFGSNVRRYINQVVALQRHAGEEHHVRVIAVEGDSRDNTRAMLTMVSEQAHVDLELVTCNHGQRHFGSTEEPERMVALSKVGNAIFGAVRETDDVLLYVECDLLWEPSHVGTLIDMAADRRFGIDIWGPRMMAGAAFYDIWGYRHLDGSRFSPFEDPGDKLAQEVSSIGSCLAMRANVAREIRITDDYCLVGWCKNARAAGYRIGCYWPSVVNHP